MIHGHLFATLALCGAGLLINGCASRPGETGGDASRTPPSIQRNPTPIAQDEPANSKAKPDPELDRIK
ncbi:MAG: hypothetical protein AUJ92_09570 [Armatimonadetes bacterium CG2_30_59_28]|nr:MAG: hypothetical protein AUJ92_09570 [Armatimonadetes bacterium CG2_30_59_28]PIU67297.1 MAG: hypothetical protein COS85_01120 [Armatimonadetes bacterium CG07_land_8_20_14_0_80_59_28]